MVKMDDMILEQDLKRDLAGSYNKKWDLIIGAIVVGIFCIISFIYLYAISLNSTRSDWDFKTMFMLLFATNLVFGVAIIGILIVLFNRLHSNK